MYQVKQSKLLQIFRIRGDIEPKKIYRENLQQYPRRLRPAEDYAENKSKTVALHSVQHHLRRRSSSPRRRTKITDTTRIRD